MSSPIRRRLALVAALVVVASACSSGTKSPSKPPVSLAVGPASATAIAPDTVINFGDQQQNFETLLQASGVLAGAAYKVNFIEFNSGPLVDAGFAAQRIDLGFMGDLPASLAVKSGLPVKAIAVELPIGASLYLLAKPGITSIAQLRGKRVAYTTGTAEQAVALRALATVGLTQRDVQQVNVSLLQLGTVLESGAADASVVTVEQKVDYEQTHPGAQVLATTDSIKPASYVYVLGATAALGDPAKTAAIDDLTRRLIEATTWEKTHQSDWVSAYYVGLKHQTPAVARLILSAGGTSNFVPITADVQSGLQNVVDLLAGAGAIPHSYSVAPLFDPTESQHYNTIIQEVTHNG